MTKEKIKESYKIASEYLLNPYLNPKSKIEDLVQIGMQMAINGEVLFTEEGLIEKIE